MSALKIWDPLNLNDSTRSGKTILKNEKKNTLVEP